MATELGEASVASDQRGQTGGPMHHLTPGDAMDFLAAAFDWLAVADAAALARLLGMVGPGVPELRAVVGPGGRAARLVVARWNEGNPAVTCEPVSGGEG